MAVLATLTDNSITSYQHYLDTVDQLVSLSEGLGQRYQALASSNYCYVALEEDPASAIELAAQLLEQHSNQDPSLLAEFHTCQALALQYTGRFEEGLRAFETTLLYALDGSDDFMLARTKLSLGKSYADLGRIRPALEQFLDVLPYFQQQDQPIWLARTLKDTAAAFTRLLQWQAAERYLAEAFELLPQLPPYVINELYLAKMNLQLAQEQLEPLAQSLAEMRLRNPDTPSTLFSLDLYQAHLYVLADQPRQARVILDEAHNRLEELRQQQHIAYNQSSEWQFEYVSALYDLNFGSGAQAKAFFLQALTEQDFQLDHRHSLEVLTKLAASHHQLGEYQQAYQRMLDYVELFSSTLDEANQLQLSQLQGQLANERDNQQLILQQRLDQQRIQELELLRKWQQLSIVAMILAVTGVLVALWQQWQRSRTLRTLALTDELTQIANRRAILAFAEQQLGLAQTREQPFALLVVDIDHFKLFNDQHGHEIGDQVLKLVSHCLAANLRQRDSVGRSGGEEFLVALTQVDDSQAFDLAERLRLAVANLSLPNIEQRIHVSIGLARWQGEDDLQQLISRADRGLYLAKQCGRNQSCWG